MLTHEEVEFFFLLSLCDSPNGATEECHGSMSYRQDFRWNVAPYTAAPAQDSRL